MLAETFPMIEKDLVQAVRLWPGRARFVVEGLRGNKKLAAFLGDQLGKIQDWVVVADPRSGRVLIAQTTHKPSLDWGQEARTQLRATLIRYRDGIFEPSKGIENVKTLDSETGLSTHQAMQKLEAFGPNVLPNIHRPGWRAILAQQLEDRMVLLLLFAAMVSLALKRRVDAFAILSVLAISAGVAIWQENQIQKEDQGLSDLEASVAHVRRDGVRQVLSAKELVPGDVVYLEAGDAVPADGYLLHANRLQVDESTLTGEAVPVAKSAKSGEPELLYLGTSVTSGKAKMVVMATGAGTYLGQMAKDLSVHEIEATPLQHRIQKLSKTFSVLIGVWAGVTATVALARGHSLPNVLMTNLTMYVSAIPEGLPLLLLVAQVYTARKVHRSTLQVRRLQSLESLALTTVFCADKTGTLTRNELAVDRVWEPRWGASGHLPRWLECSVLCNNVDWGLAPWQGDPLEVALLRYAVEQGANLAAISEKYQRVNEEPFDSAYRRMSVICEDAAGAKWLLVKGAPEAVLSYCDRQTMDAAQEILAELETQARIRAYKLISFAFRPLGIGEEQLRFTDLLHDMVYVGSVGLTDPPRSEAIISLRTLRSNGVKVAMLTGDHPATASAVGRAIEMQGDAPVTVMTGEEIQKLDEHDLREMVSQASVFARLTPTQKVRIIQALKDNGEVVAMVGDGVNDALAIRHAHVGIAMGDEGSEVAKRSSAVWLLGDDLGNVAKGIKEGRHMLAGIERAIGYLLAGNVSEVLFMSSSIWLGWPVAFTPTQILFINILTDSIPTFVVLTKSGEVYPFGERGRLFGASFWRQVMVRSTVMGTVSLGLYRLGMVLYRDSVLARSLALYSVVTNQMLQLEGWRNPVERRTFLPQGRWFAGTAAGTMAALVGALYMPGLQRVFGTAALPFSGLLLGTLGALAAGFVSSTVLAKEDSHEGKPAQPVG